MTGAVAPELTVRIAEIDDDAVAVSHGAHVVVVLSAWLRPLQQLAVSAWLAEELRQRPGSRCLRVPTGQVVARTAMLADRRLADLLGRRPAHLAAGDLAYAITALAGRDAA